MPVPEPAAGVHLLDDQAARYGDFDDLSIVGMVERDWPERPRRNIFYPPSLLKALGWPSEKDRRAAADARFLDLLTSPRRRIARIDVHARRGRDRVAIDAARRDPSCAALDASPRSRSTACVSSRTRLCRSSRWSWNRFRASARGWAELRTTRSPAAAPDFTAPCATSTPRDWSVSAIETYLDCPFKFFAQHVLRLEEEPEDQEVMDPRRQGQFVHKVFERSSTRGRMPATGAVTPAQPRRRARHVHRDRRSRAGASADRRGGPRAHASARLARSGRARRGRVAHGSGAADRRWSSGCWNTGSKGIHVRDRRRSANDCAARQG